MSAIQLFFSSATQTLYDPVSKKPENQRISRAASKSFFHQTKRSVTRSWNAVVISVQTAADKVSFVAFLVIDLVYPYIGPRIQIIYLRLTGIYHSIKNALDQEKIRKELEVLKISHYEMSHHVQDHDQLQQRYRELFNAHEQLKQEQQELAETNQFHEKILSTAYSQETEAAQRRKELLEENQKIKQEKTQLIESLAHSQQELLQSLKANQELQQQLLQTQQKSTDLETQITLNATLSKTLSRIATACQQAPTQQTELDQGLEELLPLLLTQIEAAQQKLTLAKQNLPPHSSAKVPIQSFERILSTIVEYLNRIPQSLRLHNDWNQIIERLLKAQGG